LFLGDCLEILPTLPDKSVDAIITDLPYGTTACKWDTVIPLDLLWIQYERIIKDDGAIVLTAAQPFTSVLVSSNLKMFRQHLIWLKTRPTNVFNAKKQFMKWHEDICVFYKKLPTFHPQMRTDGQFSQAKVQRKNHDRSDGVFGKTGEKKDYVHESNGGLFYPKTVLEFSNVNGHKHFHPTQKPVALMEYLIRTYTNEGDVILDNTMGSGTTGVACKNTNRNFIGIEKEPKYFEIAKRRLDTVAEDSKIKS
jgi:site-specific DNA-methyltransferase (adenine-specific)